MFAAVVVNPIAAVMSRRQDGAARRASARRASARRAAVVRCDLQQHGRKKASKALPDVASDLVHHDNMPSRRNMLAAMTLAPALFLNPDLAYAAKIPATPQDRSVGVRCVLPSRNILRLAQHSTQHTAIADTSLSFLSAVFHFCQKSCAV